jgi:hypothetical protein
MLSENSFYSHHIGRMLFAPFFNFRFELKEALLKRKFARGKNYPDCNK